MDLGQPSSYLALEEGTPVYGSDLVEIGTVAHVLADPDDDIFDGLVIKMAKSGPRYRFADAPQVDTIHERGVVLGIDAEEAASLPQPSENPAALAADAGDTVPDHLHDKLMRAWDRVSGNY